MAGGALPEEEMAMASTDAYLVCPHPEHHRIDDIAVYCPTCGRLVLVRTESSDSAEPTDRALPDLQILVLTIATIGAAVLFRFTTQIWPTYLYFGLALTFLYAVVFSRGRVTVSVAAVSLGLVTLCWLAWWLVGSQL